MGRNGSNRAVYFLLLAALLVGAAAFYSRDAQAPPQEPVRVLYESKGGLVIFDHAAHSTRLDGDCTVCHHEDGDEEEKESCRACHEENEIPLMETYHQKGEDFLDDDTYQSCVSCHEEGGRDPKNCRGCHK